MSIKIACHTIGWVNSGKDYSVEETVDQIKDAGYEGIEFFEPLEKLGKEEDLRKILDEKDMKLVSISNGLDLNSEKQPYAEAKIDYAHKFGSKVVMLCCGFIDSGHSKTDEEIGLLARKLEDIGRYASRLGMSIAYHPHLNTLVETKEDIGKLLSMSKLTRICLDTAHLIAAGTDPEEVIDRWPERIVYVHLKDWDEEKRSFAELGAGNCGLDFKGVLQKLEGIGYNGWMTVEQDSAGHLPFDSAKRSRDFLKGIGY